MSTLIRLEHLSAEVRLPDGERLTTVGRCQRIVREGNVHRHHREIRIRQNQSRLHRRAAQQRL